MIGRCYLVGWLAWVGIGRLVGMVGHGGWLGRLPEGKSEHCVRTERTPHGSCNKWVFSGHTISKVTRLCGQNARPRPETSILCGLGAGWGCVPDLIVDFGFSLKKAYVLRTEVACVALAAWETRSELAWVAWKASSEAA